MQTAEREILAAARCVIPTEYSYGKRIAVQSEDCLTGVLAVVRGANDFLLCGSVRCAEQATGGR